MLCLYWASRLDLRTTVPFLKQLNSHSNSPCKVCRITEPPLLLFLAYYIHIYMLRSITSTVINKIPVHTCTCRHQKYQHVPKYNDSLYITIQYKLQLYFGTWRYLVYTRHTLRGPFVQHPPQKLRKHLFPVFFTASILILVQLRPSMTLLTKDISTALRLQVSPSRQRMIRSYQAGDLLVSGAGPDRSDPFFSSRKMPLLTQKQLLTTLVMIPWANWKNDRFSRC